jgi:hypothetical protein
MRLKGLGQLKNPVVSSEIKPATFQLVAYDTLFSMDSSEKFIIVFQRVQKL